MGREICGDREYYGMTIQELIDMVEPYDISQIDPEIIDKINAVGCQSFKYEVVKADDKVYILPVGDKPIKIVMEREDDNKGKQSHY